MEASIKAKIQNLLRKSRDSGSSEAEAEACAAKARKLMDEYGVSEESVKEREGAAGSIRMEYRDKEAWRKILGGKVAKYYGCVTIQEDDLHYYLIGQSTSQMVASEMFSYLQDTVERLSLIYGMEEVASWHEVHEFRRACGQRVATRLHEAFEAIQAGARVAGTGTAVVVLTEYQKSLAWLKANMRVRSVSLTAGGRGAAGEAGRAAGDGVSFSDQIGTGGKRRGPLALT
jgi:Protein of unknown function (DUF2786)